MEPVALPACTRLEWDSKHFQVAIGRVLKESVNPSFLAEVDRWANREEIQCMYLLLNASDAPSVRAANESFWRFVDIRLTLSATIGPPAVRATSDNNLAFRPANHADLLPLKTIAARAHRDSRFYSDGHFNEAACDDLFRKWIERSVIDSNFARVVNVADNGQGIEGYVTCGVDGDIGHIGLIAVSEESRGRGVGASLLRSGLDWFHGEGIDKVQVVTQGANVRAARLYERAGFKVSNVELWFHKWWAVPQRR